MPRFLGTFDLAKSVSLSLWPHACPAVINLPHCLEVVVVVVVRRRRKKLAPFSDN